MRRFENDKRFWEITLDGRSVLTRSGTLGKAGRESSKRFTSAKLAVEEIDKRIGKRLADGGWFEVLPPFEGPADLTPRIEDLDPHKVDAWVRRPDSLVVDGDAAAAEVSKSLQLGLERYRAGLGRSMARDAVVCLLDEGPQALPDSEEARAALLAMSPTAAAADLLVARFGLRQVIATVAQGPRLGVNRDLRTAWLEEDVGKKPKVRAAIVRLRDLLRRADEATYAACEELVSDAMGQSLARDLELVSLFPSTPWVDDFLRGQGLVGPAVQVVGCATVGCFCDLWKARRPTVFNGPKKLAPQLEQVLTRHGGEAAPALFLLADAMGAEGMPLLGRVRTTEAVNRLLKLVDDGARGSAARAALVAMSDRTLATLAAKKRLKKGELELAEELARQPGLVPALVQVLPDAQANRVRRWAGDEEQLPTAKAPPPLVPDGTALPLEAWLRLPDVRPLRAPDGQQCYPASATAQLVGRLMAGVEPDFVEQVLAVCDPASVDEVLADVLTAWREGAAEPLYGKSPWSLVTDESDDEWGEHRAESRWVRDRKAPEEMEVPWVLHAIDALGGDACSESLFRSVLAWGSKGGRYPELLPQALDTMCRLGGEGNLVRLGALARRVQKAKVRIEQHLARVAREAGLSREHLDEMLLPTLGLDARGTLVLDYGSRSFVASFDASLKPVLRDADGKVRRSLPKASAKDDAKRAKEAQATWKELKAQVRTLRTNLLDRLEKGMRTQRSRRSDAFLRYLAKHPLAQHAVRSLVWSVGSGEERVLFRLDESGDPVDVHDEALALEGGVRLAHPALMSADELAAWREVAADYELLPPFPQLARATHGVKGVLGLEGRFIERGRLFALRNKGWVFHSSRIVEDVTYDQSMLYALSLTLGGVRVGITPVAPIDLKVDEGLEVGAVHLFDGEWSDVPKVALAEIARDLQRAVGAEA